MAKKKRPDARSKGETEAELPKFSGFNALAAGLGDIKVRVEAEQKATEEARKAAGKKPLPPPPARPSNPTPPKRTAESDRDDDLVFHRMMSGVTPLAERAARIPVVGAGGSAPTSATKTTPADLRVKAVEEAKSVLDHLHHLVDDAVRFEVIDDGKRVEGRRLDAPPSLVRELRRGVLPIDTRLDLHGLVAEAARERLLVFLKTERARGERCVLVIHGKGEHSAVPGGVLRGEISAWLSQGRAREHVAAFVTARVEDGGEGAVYVALRRS